MASRKAKFRVGQRVKYRLTLSDGVLDPVYTPWTYSKVVRVFPSGIYLLNGAEYVSESILRPLTARERGKERRK